MYASVVRFPPVPAAMSRVKSVSLRAGSWLPNQHGAWAILAVPLITGSALRSPPDPLGSVLLGGCFVTGYFGFFAASQWLKSPPRRRSRHLAPLLAYTSSAAALGLLALLRTGPALIGWVPVFATLLVPGLWLASRRNERAIAGGALTTMAACLMLLALCYDSPVAVIEHWPASRPAVLASAALFGYFFGTVLHVKSLIRERGNRGVEAASLLWHLGWTAAAAILWPWPDGWLWLLLFALSSIRAWLLPRLARTAPLRPAVIGSVELPLSALALLSGLLTRTPV